MARRPPRPRRTRTPRRATPARAIARHHAEWLSLLEISGPFLSLPVLERVFPTELDADDPGLAAELRAALDEWRATDAAAVHMEWVRFVLERCLGLSADLLLDGDALPANTTFFVAEHRTTLRPDIVLVDPDDRNDGGKARLLVQVVGRDQNLNGPPQESHWAASPATRMSELLKCCSSTVRLGLVTNGADWMLVHAPSSGSTAFVTWQADLWLDERLTLRAFRSLLGTHRFFGVPDDETLEALLDASAEEEQEVTDQLGLQMRRAVEIFVTAIDRVDRQRNGELLHGLGERRIYEAVVTVMMRLVFLLYSEERDLLPLSDETYASNYSASRLHERLRRDADQHGAEVLEHRTSAWTGLLATFRAVHAGLDHDTMRLPAYGGGLFDPDRFPFLEGRSKGSKWREVPADPVPIDDRTILDVMTELQFLGVRSLTGNGVEKRRLSYKGLGVEQIGHVYESLLDHTVVRARGPVISVNGTAGHEPELSIDELDAKRSQSQSSLLEHLMKHTGRSRKSLAKAIEYVVPEADVERWIVASEGDRALYERVRPYAGLVREGPRQEPVVVPDGCIYVTQGSDRRSSGTYYTPPSLTEPIVKHTLEPLVYSGPAEGKQEDEWVLRSAREILELRVCDLAMGSAAFLVQACRYLAERLVEAWNVAESQGNGREVVSLEGDLSTGAAGELALPRDPEERLGLARRAVTDRCLYGVDRDPMAVEMAKLSLWLVTLQRGRPFTFLDHAMKCGDSLLGVQSVEQLESYDLAPTAADQQVPLWVVHVKSAMEEARSKRVALESFVVADILDATRKARLLTEADHALERVGLAADLLVGAALCSGSESGVRYDELRRDLSFAFGELFDDRLTGEAAAGKLAGLRERAKRLLEEGRPEGGMQREPFHWAVEFPEVMSSGGFDAFVGNPPFQGGQKITGALGTDYRDYLVSFVAAGARGSADLCAYMYLRAATLLREGGSLGLIATNTIAQGDTREVGLDKLIERGYSIHRVVSSQKWPGQANLEVAVVWMTRRNWRGTFTLDGAVVSSISPRLEVPGRVTGNPYRLIENADASFQGSIVLGMGFVLEPDEAKALIAKDSRNEDVLFPYLNGEDLNSRWDQSPSRWVINFHDWPLERAGGYDDCMRIVEETVRPERERLRDTPDGRRLKERWWQFCRSRPELYSTIAAMRRVLVTARVSKYRSFVLVPRGIVYSEATVVIASESAGMFAILSSALHEHWTLKYQSSLRKDSRYTPSDCFETFPFPENLERLYSIGSAYHEHRADIMRQNEQGLTETYNRFHDPDEKDEAIARLRELHRQMDMVACESYGWPDGELRHDFRDTPRGVRFVPTRAAIGDFLDRLLELNHQRHADADRAQRLRLD